MKDSIKFLVLWGGTKCTLRCKNCCNLIPYVKQVSYDTEKITNKQCFNRTCQVLADDFMAVCGKIINLLELRGGNIEGNNIWDITNYRMNI